MPYQQSRNFVWSRKTALNAYAEKTKETRLGPGREWAVDSQKWMCTLGQVVRVHIVLGTDVCGGICGRRMWMFGGGCWVGWAKTMENNVV